MLTLYRKALGYTYRICLCVATGILRTLFSVLVSSIQKYIGYLPQENEGIADFVEIQRKKSLTNHITVTSG